MTSVILSEHLSRVTFYSRRVRSLKLLAPDPDISNSLLTIIINELQELKPLLPLKRLNIPSLNLISTPLQNSLLFLRPDNLESFTIKQITSAIVATFLHKLTLKGRTLTRLCVGGHLSRTLLAVLPSCHNLNYLEIYFFHSQISLRFLQELSSVTLRTLKISFQNRCVLQQTSSNQIYSFKNLVDLVVHGPASNIGCVLDCIRAPLLAYFHLICASNDNVDFATCIQKAVLLTGRNGQDSGVNLMVLDLKVPSAIVDYDSTIGLTSTLANVQTLRVLVPACSFLRVNLNSTLPWTHLRTLNLHSDNPLAVTTTLDSLDIFILQDIATQCPRLKFAGLPIDRGTEYDARKMQEIIQNTPAKSPALETLVFRRLPSQWSYPISAAVTLANFIDHFFPMMRSVRYAPGQNDDREQWCKGVQDILHGYKRIRERGKATTNAGHPSQPPS